MTRTECRLMTLCAVIFLLTGCMTVLPGYGPESSRPSRESRTDRIPGPTPELTPGEAVKSNLYAQLKNWQGVRYRAGGLSKSGVDCSGFIYLTYDRHFGIKLPRTTRLQSTSGRRVFRKHLQPGDLIFFKTGIFARHVGIYIENDRFLHASTKRGVMLSSLEDPYWRKRYWKAVRISR